MIKIKNIADANYHRPQLEYYTKQIDKDASINDPMIPVCYGAMARAVNREGTPFTPEEWDRASMGYNPFKEDWFNHPLNKNAQKLDENHKPIVPKVGEVEPARVPWVELVPSMDKSISVFFAAQSKATQDEMLVEFNRIVVEVLYPMIREYSMYEKDNKKYYAEDVSFITSYSHIENRSVEPYVHFHITVANSVVGHDGKTYALENKGLHDNVSLMDAAFNASVADYLRNRFSLKLVATDTKPDMNNEHLDASQKNVQSFAIAGVPQEAIELYSKRSAEIEEEMKRRGVSGPKAAEIAQVSTRTQKTDLSASELRELWRHELNEKFNFNEATSAELKHFKLTEREEQSEQELVEGFHRRTGEVCGSEAQVKAHLIKQLMVLYPPEVVEKKVVKIFEKHFQAATTPETKELYERILTTNDWGERMALEHKLASSAKYISTFYLENEQKLYTNFKARETENQNVIPRNVVAKGLRDFQAAQSKPGKPFKFNAGQMNAAFTMLSTPGAVKTIQGMAGAGKTSVVVAVREIAEKCGYRLIGTATSSQASTVLMSESGIQEGHNTTTLLLKLKGIDGKPPTLTLTDKDIVIVDEAGMTSGQELWEIGDYVNRAGAKLILQGDKDQVQAVGASGGLFRHFTKNFECAELTEIQRQKEQWQRELVTHAANGNSMDCMLELNKNGRIVITKTTQERIELISKDYLDDPTSVSNKFIVANTNEDANLINKEVQRQLLERGAFNKLMGVANVIDRDGYERKFHVGERIVFSKATKTDDPTDRAKANNSQVGKVVRIEHRKGELRAITIELDDKKKTQLTLGADKCRNLRLGSCITTHKSQGSTVKNSYLFGSSMLNNLHSFYVQVSRHKDNTKLYLSEDQVEKIVNDRRLVNPSPAQQSWARDLIAKDLADNVIDEPKAKYLIEKTETFQGCREYLNSHTAAWTADSDSSRQKVMEVKTLAQFIHIFEAMGKANYKKSSFDLAVLSQPLQEHLKQFRQALKDKQPKKQMLPVIKEQVLTPEMISTTQAPKLSPVGRAMKSAERGMTLS